MTRRNEGFTIALIPHSAHGKRRELRVTGGRVPLFHAAMVLIVIVIASSVYMFASGVMRQGRVEALNRRITGLQDSLASTADIGARLAVIEEQLEDIRATRRVIENLATQGAPSEE